MSIEENSPAGGPLAQEVEERETRVLPNGEVVTRVKVTRTFAPEQPAPDIRGAALDSGQRRRAEDVRTAITVTTGLPPKMDKATMRELVTGVRTRWAKDVGRLTKRLEQALPQLVQDFHVEQLHEAMAAVKARFPRAGPDAQTAHFIRLLRTWRTPNAGEADADGDPT